MDFTSPFIDGESGVNEVSLDIGSQQCRDNLFAIYFKVSPNGIIGRALV